MIQTNKQDQIDANLRRLATVVRDSNDAITVQDFEGNISAWNKGAIKMYGYSEAEALSMNIRDLIPSEQKREALAIVNRIKKGGEKEVESFETRRLTKSGQVIEVWLTITALVDNHGKPVGIATTERDISKFKASLKKIKQLEGLLPICASCKQIRDEKGNWNQIEQYISEHSNVKFSHSICTNCAKKLYPDIE